MTQQEVARRVGMSQRAVSYVEKQQWVKQSTLEKYAEALARPLAHFLRPYDDRLEVSGLGWGEAVQQAFEVICRDPEFGFGSRPGEQLSLETKRDIVRLYERCKGINLVPSDAS